MVQANWTKLFALALICFGLLCSTTPTASASTFTYRTQNFTVRDGVVSIDMSVRNNDPNHIYYLRNIHISANASSNNGQWLSAGHSFGLGNVRLRPGQTLYRHFTIRSSKFHHFRKQYHWNVNYDMSWTRQAIRRYR